MVVHANYTSTGPFILKTNYFLPQQAMEIKGEAVKSRPTKTVRVQAQEQK